ncbi:MFS transporter [Arthrobacter sp. NPDC093128]|uniref:MFS transporter n=1 Tax=Arthrobacter sp. NPDC093128 TaxID=3154979 RepID=UPI00343E7305
MSTITSKSAHRVKNTPRRAAIAAMVGTAIEYYEFGVYGYLAVVISPLFFPSAEPATALLSTLAVFGSAFLIRPLGGIILGRLGDLFGRRIVLLVTVIGMGTATASTGLLPTHETVGLWSPVLLLVVRLFQGFFAGGEVTGAATYVAESAPNGRRGFWGGFTPMGVAIGGAAAATVAGVCSGTLTGAQMSEFGWRIPFLMSIPLVILSILIRRKISEAHAFEELQEKNELPKAPLKTVVTKYWRNVLRVIFISFGQNVGYWVGFIFMNIYMTQYLKMDRTTVYWTMAAIGIAVAVMMPLWGGLSDRIGRRKVLTIGFVGYLVLVVPMMLLMGLGNIPLAIAAMVVLALPMPIVQSVGYPTYTEQFPTHVRYTGISLSFNIGTILGGGLTPLLATSLIASTGNLLAPGFILIGACLVALVTLLRMRETSKEELEQ